MPRVKRKASITSDDIPSSKHTIIDLTEEDQIIDRIVYNNTPDQLISHQSTLYQQITLKPVVHRVVLPAPELCYYEIITQLPNQCQLDTIEFNQLYQTHPAEYGTIKLFGRLIDTPRWHACYGANNYKFTGVEHVTHPILPNSLYNHLLQYINTFDIRYQYHSLLVNWYESGQHYMGYHSDNEADLIPNAPIYSFTYGSERLFRFQYKLDHCRTNELILLNNSCLIMGGAVQKYYKHALPKTNKPIGRRINITMRVFK